MSDIQQKKHLDQLDLQSIRDVIFLKIIFYPTILAIVLKYYPPPTLKKCLHQRRRHL